jgi:hypothetical protein
MDEKTIKKIFNVLEEIGWLIAIPYDENDPDDTPLTGMIIGTREYVRAHVECIPGDFMVFEKREDDENL